MARSGRPARPARPPRPRADRGHARGQPRDGHQPAGCAAPVRDGHGPLHHRRVPDGVRWYDGAARSVWDDLPAATALVGRFRAFPGIGEHRAEVALYLLTREYGVAVQPDRPLDTALSHCARLADITGTLCRPR
jgi:hypothetical protein